jgi:hypothetical protein
VAQQGSPPGRSLRQPVPGPDDGYPAGDYPVGDDPVSEAAGPSGRAPARHPRRERPERPARRPYDAFAADEEVPEWAGPAEYPGLPEPRRRRSGDRYADPYADPQADSDAGPDTGPDPAGHHRREPDPGADPAAPPARRRAGRRGRAAATRLRKSRRRVYRWAALAIIVCVLAAGITALMIHHTPKPSLYVTTLLPGEFKSVPAACSSVSPAVLSAYVPEPGRTTTSQISTSTDSECSFTVDRKPVFLVLEVTAQSYQPFAAASGTGTAAGSASANAQDNYALVQSGLTHPPKTSPLTAAQVTALPKVGQQAFVALQQEHVKDISTQVATVVIRERNVVITVSESGQESGHGFGPVSVTTLQSGAIAAAKDLLAKTLTQPKAT